MKNIIKLVILFLFFFPACGIKNGNNNATLNGKQKKEGKDTISINLKNNPDLKKQDSDKVKVNKEAVTSYSFNVDAVFFVERYFNEKSIIGAWTRSNSIAIPEEYKRISNKEEMLFDVTFFKRYYKTNKNIERELLYSKRFWIEVLKQNYKKEEIDFIKNFNVKEETISGIGKCVIVVFSYYEDNSQLSKDVIIVNPASKDVSIWNYDKLEIDEDGRIKVLFRLKEQRTWYYYKYDRENNFFIPLAKRSL